MHDVVAEAEGVIGISIANHAIVAATAVHGVVAGAVGAVGTPKPSIADHMIVAIAAVHDVIAGAVGVTVAISVADHDVTVIAAIHDIIAGAVGGAVIPRRRRRPYRRGRRRRS